MRLSHLRLPVTLKTGILAIMAKIFEFNLIESCQQLKWRKKQQLDRPTNPYSALGLPTTTIVTERCINIGLNKEQKCGHNVKYTGSQLTVRYCIGSQNSQIWYQQSEQSDKVSAVRTVRYGISSQYNHIWQQQSEQSDMVSAVRTVSGHIHRS